MIHRDSVDVWRIRLDAVAALPADKLAERMEMWRVLLSTEEQRRADSLIADEHRQDYVAAHAGLRFLLGMHLKVLPSSIPIETAGGTKPALAAVPISGGTGSGSDLRFNLSHTRGAILIGIASSREIGVDVEWQRPMEDLDAMARSVMSDDELSLWMALRLEERMRSFYEVWTQKEAYLKAIGLGLYRSLQDVTVSVSGGRESFPERERLVLDRSGKGQWTVAGIPAWDGYSAAICWEGDDSPSIAIRDLDILQCDLSVIAS